MTKTVTWELNAHTTRPTAKRARPASNTGRGPFQSARAPATTVALSCVAKAAPEAIGYHVVAASSSKATSVMRRTEPIASPISAGVQVARVVEGEESSAGMVTILLAARATLRWAGVQ